MLKKKIILWLLLALTVASRLYYVLESPRLNLSHDEVGYVRMTVQFLNKGFLGYYSDKPNAFVTPGYPLFLAFIFWLASFAGANSLLAVRVIQVFLSAGTVFMVFIIGQKCVGYKTGIFAAFLTAIYPPAFMANNRILTEVLFSFFLLIYIYLLIIAISEGNNRYHALSGLVMGLTVLVRPAVAPFLIVPYLLLLWKYRKSRVLKNCFAAIIMFSAVMFPWWIRNYLVFDKIIVLATQSGNPLLRGTDPYDPYNKIGPSIMNVPEEAMTKVAMDRIKGGFQSKPLYWLKWFTVGKFIYLWKRPWGMVDAFSVTLHQFIFVFLGWLGTLYNLHDEKLRYPSLLIILITLTQLAFIPIERYMYPLTPLMALMTTSSLSKIVQRHLTLKT